MKRGIKYINKVIRKSKIYFNINYWRTRSIIVLIYTGGKVGSSTVYYNLKRSKLFSDVLHVHFLSEHWLKSFKESGRWLSNIRKAEDVKNTLKQKPNKRVKIITLVREPVARDISDVFQNFKTIFEINSTNELKELDIQNHLSVSKFNQTEMWFETEFKEYTGIDILQLPFDKKNGYSIYNLKEFDVLCLKLETLNDSFEDIIHKFLGIKEMKSVVENNSLEKDGAHLYKKIKNEFNLPENKLNEIYSTNFITHFYSKNEIIGFVNKWKVQ